jgi:hypothetical protein
MTCRHITVLFVIGSLVVLFACPHALLAGPGKTVKLSIPNLPRGG